MILTYKTTHEAYEHTVRHLIEQPDHQVSPRGKKIYEILNYSFRVLEPTSEPIITKDVEFNKSIACYTLKEMELYAKMTDSAQEFTKAAKFWDKIKTPAGTINSAYGKLIWDTYDCGNKFEQDGPVYRTPWQWARLALSLDKDSRQAIIHFNRPSVLYLGNLDLVCTMFAQFFIRSDKLSLHVTMRSNDVRRGILYDMPWFCSLIEKMRSELLSIYPYLKIGSYYHNAMSMHLYDSDVEQCKKMVYGGDSLKTDV